MKTRLPKLVIAAMCIAVTLHPANSLAQAPPGPPAAVPAPELLSADQLEGLVARIALYPMTCWGWCCRRQPRRSTSLKGSAFFKNTRRTKASSPIPRFRSQCSISFAYPEVVTLMSNDLDWTKALGQAVLAQQADVLQAIQIFRRKAQSAGNLKTDDKQVVAVEQDVVKIIPAKQDVIYVPQYQPSAVVEQQSAPAVTYSTTAYPSYYAPGAAAVATTGFVAGAATAYGLNWGAGSLYYGAPYAQQTAYNQEARQNYGNNAREDWQNYGNSSRQDWQNYANSSQTQRQQSSAQNQSTRQQTTTSKQTQRQQSAQQTTGVNQTQRQQSASNAQTQQAATQGQRQSGGRKSSGGSSSGAFADMSSGAQSKSYSQRGEQSMSSMNRSGGGGGNRSTPSGSGRSGSGRSGGGHPKGR